MQKKIILDTFTLQEIKKDMRMYIWVEVNKYHRKPEEEEKKETNKQTNKPKKKPSRNQITYIHTRFYIYIYNDETINMTTTTI